MNNNKPKKFILEEKYIKKMGDKNNFNKEIVKSACLALVGVALLSGSIINLSKMGTQPTGPLSMGSSFGGLSLTISSVISMFQAIYARKLFKKYYENNKDLNNLNNENGPGKLL